MKMEQRKKSLSRLRCCITFGLLFPAGIHGHISLITAGICRIGALVVLDVTAISDQHNLFARGRDGTYQERTRALAKLLKVAFPSTWNGRSPVPRSVTAGGVTPPSAAVKVCRFPLAPPGEVVPSAGVAAGVEVTEGAACAEVRFNDCEGKHGEEVKIH